MLFFFLYLSLEALQEILHYDKHIMEVQPKAGLNFFFSEQQIP